MRNLQRYRHDTHLTTTHEPIDILPLARLRYLYIMKLAFPFLLGYILGLPRMFDEIHIVEAISMRYLEPRN
jgi:hypothetical protein